MLVNVTYEIVTPESAERGDYDDSGFLDYSGQRHSVRGLWGEAAGKLKAECAMPLRVALNHVAPASREDSSFYEVDGRTDYRTGEVETRALHALDSVTPASLARLSRVLGV